MATVVPRTTTVISGPSTSEPGTKESQRCLICKAQATGFHFDAQSCSACAAFFRRTVALSKNFTCINGQNQCEIYYTMHQICRSCRFIACLNAGMDRNGVQPRRTTDNHRRSFFTRSGLKRNKRFAVLAAPIDEEEASAASSLLNTPAPSSSASSPSFTAVCSPIEPLPRAATASPSRSRSIKIEILHATPSPLDTSFVSTIPSPYPIPDRLNALELLVKEEQKLGERRRIVFCERPVGQMLGVTRECPFTKEDIKPLSFRAFRKQIRTHILFIYEWLQAWPDYATLDNADRVSILRSCVLLHTILDPIYITLRIGLPDRFVMQNGGYLSCVEGCGEGWEEESEISEQTKRTIYEPLLKKIMAEIVPPMVALDMTFEEFVALKAFVSFQGAIPNVSEKAKEAMRRQIAAVTCSLHSHLIANGSDPAERIGGIILLLSGIFSTGLEFVESHRQIHFFDLWQLDSLLLQLLNLDAILEATKDF